MTRFEKAKLLQSSRPVQPSQFRRSTKSETLKTFELDGEQIPYKAERPTPSEANAQANRDWLRQARECSARNDD